MARIGLWHVTATGPEKLDSSGVGLEKYLEEWIERDPNLLQAGLTIIGRQIRVEGGILDLLALDPQGRWAVVEVKSGTVRRETVAQVLDYASCIATMPYDELAQKVNAYLNGRNTTIELLLKERESDESGEDGDRDVVMFVVGTGREPGLERMIAYLSDRFGLPVTVVSYEVFEIDSGHKVLARELTEPEIIPSVRSGERQRVFASVEDLCALADSNGIGQEFRKIVDTAQKHNMHVRSYRQRIILTPPSNRARTLSTVFAVPARGSDRLIAA
ncbi:MAG: DUF91 domain-containing protein, partial [Anaerolineae bacterium]|nr:DUF91 domain-containing protein [Anaerolineae bacterium]